MPASASARGRARLHRVGRMPREPLRSRPFGSVLRTASAASSKKTFVARSSCLADVGPVAASASAISSRTWRSFLATPNKGGSIKVNQRTSAG